MTQTIEQVRVVDADSHLLEVPDLWTSRIASKYLDQIPHVLSRDGKDWWRMGDRWLHPVQAFGIGDAVPPTNWDEVDPACWEVGKRLDWMDRHGIWAQILYPNLVAFQTFALMDADPEVARLVIQAYNDYLVEWSAPAKDRFALISMVPFWDIDETIAEMTRCREMGHHGVLWAMTMEHHKLPPVGNEHWDPVYAAAQDLGMSMSFHIATGETEGVLASLAAETDSRVHVKNSVPIGLGNANAIAEVVTSEVCHKFPGLNFVSVESGFGYLPYVLELMDWQWKTGGGPKQFPHRMLPSEYFRRQVYSMFWFETGTLDLLEQYQDNVMFESDFPHPTSLTPTQYTVGIPSPESLVNAHLERFPEHVMQKVMHGNAARVYHLD